MDQMLRAMMWAWLAVLMTVCFPMFVLAADSNIIVEVSSPPILHGDILVSEGSTTVHVLELTKGNTLVAKLRVNGGKDNKAMIWLMEEAEYKKLRNKEKSVYIKGAGGEVTSEIEYTFSARQTGLYYLVVSNQDRISRRYVNIYAYEILPDETTMSSYIKNELSRFYKIATAFLDVQEFRVISKRCGFVNAFSDQNNDITVCTEYFDSNDPNVVAFTLFHELGHTLLKSWGYPLYDNEDVVDEFACVVAIFLDQKQWALKAAEQYENESLETRIIHSAINKLIQDDRHTIAPQRARNIKAWIDQGPALVRRWQKLLVPKIKTESLVLLSGSKESWVDHELVNAELLKRAAVFLTK